jgi:hypothetical protein
MTDWWMSTLSKMQFRESSYETPENEKHLRESQGIDSALLAADLGISPLHVEAYQRKLGLRPLAVNNPGISGRYSLDMRGRHRKNQMADSLFDPLPIKKPAPEPTHSLSSPAKCMDCGHKPAQAMDRCQECFQTWARQVEAVHRALDQ